MPHFRAKKRCQYGGKVYEKNEVAEFFEPISAQSWEAMDAEGEELLIYPEDEKPKVSGKSEEAEVLVSGEEFADLQATYESLLNDFTLQKEHISILEQERDAANQSVADLRTENEQLAKSAEDATAMQGKVAGLKQMVKDNENKSVLEEAIEAL